MTRIGSALVCALLASTSLVPGEWPSTDVAVAHRLVHTTQLARALTILKRPARATFVVVPLLGMPLADAADVAFFVFEGSIAGRARQRRRRQRRLLRHESRMRLDERGSPACSRIRPCADGVPRRPCGLGGCLARYLWRVAPV